MAGFPDRQPAAPSRGSRAAAAVKFRREMAVGADMASLLAVGDVLKMGYGHSFEPTRERSQGRRCIYSRNY
ncbi:hypothetical protein GCM10028864_46850 [Microlunatus parietis]